MFFDPVLSCNLRCRMCYFSDAEKRKELHGRFSDEDIRAIAKALFPYMLKLQIGCGAEPTVYSNLSEVVRLAKHYGVPYVSITTNGMLLSLESLKKLAESGLDEVTLSVHGLSAATYEDLMQGAKFSKFKELIGMLKQAKAETGGKLKIRINYTINEDNVDDLTLFPEVFGGLHVDVLQLRPIQKIGESDYKNFSKQKIIENYDKCIMSLVEYCRKQNTLCIYPSHEDLLKVDGCEDTDKTNDVVNMIPYFQLSPFDGWKEKINPYEEDFYGYCRRNRRVGYMLRNIIRYGHETEEDVTKSMNYNVK